MTWHPMPGEKKCIPRKRATKHVFPFQDNLFRSIVPHTKQFLFQLIVNLINIRLPLDCQLLSRLFNLLLCQIGIGVSVIDVDKGDDRSGGGIVGVGGFGLLVGFGLGFALLVSAFSFHGAGGDQLSMVQEGLLVAGKTAAMAWSGFGGGILWALKQMDPSNKILRSDTFR
ncbi:hypothetical protein Droror1_Dr00018031 [Drosera rotundifolia]